MGEYNESIYYYEETLKGQPDFKAAETRLAAVKCQFKLQVDCIVLIQRLCAPTSVSS